jgi:hypothetical protein
MFAVRRRESAARAAQMHVPDAYVIGRWTAAAPSTHRESIWATSRVQRACPPYVRQMPPRGPRLTDKYMYSHPCQPTPPSFAVLAAYLVHPDLHATTAGSSSGFRRQSRRQGRGLEIRLAIS